MFSEALMPGLTIAIVGMSLVFLAQALLMAAIWVLDRAFRTMPAAGTPQHVESPLSGGASDAEVAAIAVALQYLQLREAAQRKIGGESLGSELAADRSFWGAADRREQQIRGGWGDGR